MKKKFKLNQLEVNSFVTSMPKAESDTVKGGNSRDCSLDHRTPCPVVPITLECVADLSNPVVCHSFIPGNFTC